MAVFALAGLSGCDLTEAVIISEFVASNTRGLTDGDGETSDWIELHNRSDSAAALDGWCLTDDPRRLERWCLPAVSIPARGYLLVFASGKRVSDSSAQLHATFKLKATGDYLALVKPGGALAQEFAPYPDQKQNVSFGLTARGTNDFLAVPTPGAPNH